MCGIFGFIGNHVNKEYIKLHALYNESRGSHATGIYSDKYGIVKDCIKASKFITQYSNKLSCNKILIGHTRYATHGANIKEYAHPFMFGNVTGVHNGVLGNYLDIAQLYGTKSIQVDSKCIFIAIKNEPNEADIFPEIIGAMAIAYTKNDGYLYLFKRENPLYIGVTKNGIYFSSILDSIIACDIKQLYELEENIIYKFSPNGLISQEIVKEPKSRHYQNWDDFYSNKGLDKYSNNAERGDYKNEGFSYYELMEYGLDDETAKILLKQPDYEQWEYLVENGYI